MLIKFCGLRSKADLEKAAGLKADFGGFIFHRASPRYVSPENAASLPMLDIARVGVFVEATVDEILAIGSLAGLDYIQLHGEYSLEDARKIGPQRTIRVLWPERCASIKDLLEEAALWRNHCAFFLLDSGKKGGGSGISQPWEALGGLTLPKPWFLAGGLAPENAWQAYKACRPDGLDFNSGVEIAPAVKSHEKMAKAVSNLNSFFKGCR